MTKYSPLREHLQSRTDSIWEADFEEINDIVALPPAAYRSREWWVNARSRKHGPANAWLQAGWRTWEVDLAKKRVTFYRSVS